MRWWQRWGRRSEQRQAGFFTDWPVTFRGEAEYLAASGGTADSALCIPAVLRAVTLVSRSLSMLPLQTFRDLPDGSRQKLGAGALLSRPQADAGLIEWLDMLMMSVLLRGNAYGLILARDAMMRPTQIKLQHPDDVRVKCLPDGSLEYRLRGQVVPSKQVWHFRGARLPGCDVGLSPISYAAVTFGLASAAEMFGRQFFNESAVPMGILSTDQIVDQDQAETVKRRFLANTKENRGVAVLGGGVSYQPITIAPEEAQFLQTQAWTVEQVARVFGVPAEMIGGSAGGGGSVTYANAVDRRLDLLVFSLQWWLERVEEALTDLLPRPQYVKFNTAALLRTDTKTRYDAYASGLAAGFLTVDEVRQWEELAPLTAQQKAEMQPAPVPAQLPSGVGQ